MLSSPELHGLIPLLDWPHDIVGPYLCPSATPQGSQGLTLVSQDKVRGIWEWGCVRTHPNAVVCSERLHLACLPTKRPGLHKKPCLQPEGARLLVPPEQVRLLWLLQGM